jgi:hypothetical protein
MPPVSNPSVDIEPQTTYPIPSKSPAIIEESKVSHPPRTDTKDKNMLPKSSDTRQKDDNKNKITLSGSIHSQRK